MTVKTDTTAQTSTCPTNSCTRLPQQPAKPTIVPPQTTEYTLGQTVDGTAVFDSCRPKLDKDAKIIVGIKGNWYDVTTYVPYHPGGDVLKEFAGRDCTSQFLAYHHMHVLDKRKPIGTYDWDPEAPNGDPMDATYLKLYEKFTKLGYFGPCDMWWFAMNVSVVLGAFLATWASVLYYCKVDPSSNLAFYGSAMLLGFFWHQAGIMMHDSMHNHLFQNRKIDQALGWIFANCCFGLSGRWWRDEHTEHHLFPNTVVSGVAPSDPQMTEGVWIHNKFQVQFYPKLKHLLLPVQHFIYLPALFGVGYLGLRVDCYLSERRVRDFIGIGIYWAWLLTLLSFFPTWNEAFWFHYVASSTLGILELQLTVSHYSKGFDEKMDTKDGTIGWLRRQISVSLDIENPWWTDWFHGGLNFHTVHHAFPRMCRQHYRAVYSEMKDALRQHKPEDNVVMPDRVPFGTALKRTIGALKDVQHFKYFDPRK